MRKYNGINRRGFLRSAMLSGAAMCVSSISNEMVANESRDKQEPLALGSKVAAGISAKRTLGSGTASMVVSAIGFGCMGLNYHRSQHPGKKQVIALVHEAIDRGVTLFDTAESYGYQTNERLVGEALKGYSDRVFVTTKFGHKFVDGVQIKTEEDSSPNNIRKVCENSLRNLGVETLGMFYQHRADPNTPIEVVAETVNELIREGKVLHFGLCEVNADTIRRAHRICPVTAIQSEYHLMHRAVEDSILPLCEELGIGFVPYSPINRGFLGGLINEQVALAWLMNKKPWIVAIPGTTKLSHLEENLRAADIIFTAGEMRELEDAVSAIPVVGSRYNALQESKVQK